MKTKNTTLVSIVCLLSACGGGGGGSEVPEGPQSASTAPGVLASRVAPDNALAVPSGQPIAPTVIATAPTTVNPGPVSRPVAAAVTTPVIETTPSNVTSPKPTQAALVTPETTAEAPAAPPLAPTFQPPLLPAERLVAGAVLYEALAKQWQSFPPGPESLGSTSTGPSSISYYYQQYQEQPRGGPSGFIFASQGWNEEKVGSSRYNLSAWHVGIPATVAADGRVSLKPTMNVSVTEPVDPVRGSVKTLEDLVLANPSGVDFSVNPNWNYELDTSIAIWSNPQWYVELIIQSDDDVNLFRLCWHGKLKTVKRVMCGVYSRFDGSRQRIRVLDDSYDLGTVQWGR